MYEATVVTNIKANFFIFTPDKTKDATLLLSNCCDKLIKWCVSYLMAAARGRRGGSVSEDNCVKCKKKSGGCWFQCDACDSWTHAECMSMTAEEYQTLKKFPNFRY